LPNISPLVNASAVNGNGTTIPAGTHLRATSANNGVLDTANYGFYGTSQVGMLPDGTALGGTPSEIVSSNPIYGASNTVQPYSCTVRYIIKAYDGVTPTPAEADISEMLTELTGKADRRLSNLDTANLACHVVVDSYYDDTTGDWWREYDDGWVEQGGDVATTDNQTITVNLLKAMADNKYTVLTSRRKSEGGVYLPCVKTRTTTTITILGYDGYSIWYVAGMGASV
jgi:hypothetical protein